jgi:hypothetical protein
METPSVGNNFIILTKTTEEFHVIIMQSSKGDIHWITTSQKTELFTATSMRAKNSVKPLKPSIS